MQNAVSLRTRDDLNESEANSAGSMRILIADDHDLVRETIGLFLKAEGIHEIVCVGNLEKAIEAADDTGSFDLVLLDFDMPGMNGLQGLPRMKEANANYPVALMSGTATPRIAKDAIAAGAAGFVPKTLAAKSMISAVHFMACGETYVPYDFLQQPEVKPVGDLTKRETDGWRGLCKGKSNKEIGVDLSLQEVTIKLHVKTLCRKLNAKNRTHAAMIGRDRDLV